MALPVREQVKYWCIALAVLFLLLLLLGSVILPFVVGGALAYFLDPVADRLQRLGLSRVAATTVITLVALLFVVLLVLSVIPTLIQQTSALVNAAPEIARRLQGFMIEKFPELTDSTSTMRTTLARNWRGHSGQGSDFGAGGVDLGAEPVVGGGVHRRGAGGDVLHAAGLGSHGGAD